MKQGLLCPAPELVFPGAAGSAWEAPRGGAWVRRPGRRGAQGCGCHRPAPGLGGHWRSGSEMASPPPDSQKTWAENPKGMLAVQSLSPHGVPWATVVTAVSHFRMSLPALRRDQLLASLDPLALNKYSLPSVQHPTMPQALWGDQEPLSKVRASGKPRVLGPVLHPSLAPLWPPRRGCSRASWNRRR